jgi:hypothetical protein
MQHSNNQHPQQSQQQQQQQTKDLWLIRPKLEWDMDMNGPGGKSSLQVLLDWMSNGDNFLNWRFVLRKPADMLNEIRVLMRASGASQIRTDDDISKKLSELEKCK